MKFILNSHILIIENKIKKKIIENKTNDKQIRENKILS